MLISKLFDDWRARALAVWILPGLTYYVFIHVQQSGHTFTIMPAIIIVAAIAVVRAAQYLSTRSRVTLAAVTSIVVAANGLFFLLGPEDIFGPSRVTLALPTRRSIRAYDDYVSTRLEAIRGHFPPASTVVLAGSRNFRVPDYYLRDYQLTSLSHQLGSEQVVLPAHVRALVFLDDAPLSRAVPYSSVRTLPLGEGGEIRYVSLSSNQRVKLSLSSFEIQGK
jgi:hypothetical protein